MSSLSTSRRPPRNTGVPAGLFYAVSGTLLTVIAGLVLVLSMHADIVKLVVPASNRTIAIYETRIADLRTEIDRLNSRQFARDGDINLQVRDLVQQQEDLSEQHHVVKALTRMAEDLGLVAAERPSPQPAAAPSAANDTAAVSLTEIGASLTAMQVENTMAMASLADLARTASDKVDMTLSDIGIPTDAVAATGGPFEPASATEASSLTDAANAVALQLRRFAVARDAAADAPVHRPLVGSLRQTSPFGVRTDPFVGSKAFHSGLDLAASTGTGVLAAGAGRVSFAGKRSGYGILVEIDHGDGIVTRYGHLSGILVKVGDKVSTGDVIASSGSTGRSTGPHLHFEVRRDDKPVDPNAFLNAGRSLQAIL